MCPELRYVLILLRSASMVFDSVIIIYLPVLGQIFGSIITEKKFPVNIFFEMKLEARLFFGKEK